MMNFRYPTYVILFSILFLSPSCASVDNRYIPVFTSQPRISSLGFSISPPPGANWYEKVHDGSLLYLKKLTPDNYCMYTRATELHFSQEFAKSEDFLQHVKLRKGVNTAPDLFKNVHYSYKLSTEYDNCVRYQQEYEDHRISVPPSTEPGDFAVVASSGLICVHPEKPGIGIDMYYLERSLPGTSITSYSHEGERFLRSLTFLPGTSAL